MDVNTVLEGTLSPGLFTHSTTAMPWENAQSTLTLLQMPQFGQTRNSS